MLLTDADAKALLKEHNNLPMPNQSLSNQEIAQYLKYFRWVDAQPAGSLQAAAGAH
jgi:nitrite reductase (NO-forming)